MIFSINTLLARITKKQLTFCLPQIMNQNHRSSFYTNFQNTSLLVFYHQLEKDKIYKEIIIKKDELIEYLKNKN